MIDKLRNFTFNLSTKVVYGIMGVICFYLFSSSIYSTSIMWYDTEITYYIKDFPLLMVIGLIVMMLLFFILRNLIKKILTHYKIMIVLFTLIWAVLLTVFVCNSDISLVYDQARVYEAIEGLVNGDYNTWQTGGYIYCYPFQNGMVLLYAPIMLIFGDHTYTAVQVLSIILYWLMAVAFYKLSKIYFDRTVAFFTYISILFFLPLWGYVKYFYGNLPGLSFVIWSIYFITSFMENHRWRYLIGSALCLSLAIVFKGNFLIYGFAIIIVLIVESIYKKKTSYLIAAVTLGLVVILANKIPTWVAGWITGCETDQGIPTVQCIAMGLRESYVAPGWYSGDSLKAFEENQYSVARFEHESWEDIRNSLMMFAQNKDYALTFFGKKTASIWNNPTFEGFAVVVKGNVNGTINYWMKDILYNGGIWNSIIMLVMDVIQSIILFGNLLYLMYCKKEHSLQRAIPLVAFIGGFLFHIFWEGKCQYTILFYVILITYALAGYKYCMQRIIEWHNGQSRLKKILESKKVHMFGVLMAVLLIIGVWNNPILDATIKLHGDEESYIWLFNERSYWKHPDFTKEGFWE